MIVGGVLLILAGSTSISRWAACILFPVLRENKIVPSLHSTIVAFPLLDGVNATSICSHASRPAGPSVHWTFRAPNGARRMEQGASAIGWPLGVWRCGWRTPICGLQGQ